MKKISSLLILAGVLSLSASLTPSAMRGQVTSVNGGSIQGTITDATGAAIPGATVHIVGTDTGSTVNAKTDGAGYYSVGPLNPGSYSVTISQNGFNKLDVKTVVRTGTATSGNFKLLIGSESTTIEVNAGEVQVNTEQIGVTGVITGQQIDTLPVNGRNILDFAQLQPGVQLQPGGSGDGGFDPTKAGYSALSFNGVSGRTTRILLDGQDITDETVGTTIYNVSQGAVGEFQVSRSTNDVSSEITSSGSVLASTRSGTNTIHGELFYVFQDQRVGAATFEGVADPFQRNQFGGSVGGPIIKDKLFFFANSERLKQDQEAGVTLYSPFAAIQAQYPNVASPDRDTYSTGRLDYNGPFNGHYFARINYEANGFDTGTQYSTYANRDNAPGYAFGADFAHGHMTHSFRGSYEKFHNFIADTTNGSTSIYNPLPGYGLSDSDGAGLNTGPNPNAPQATFQSDKQLRYDGSWTKGSHTIRFGGSLNRILGGGDAKFFGYGPQANFYSGTALASCGTGGTAACLSDPVNGYAPYYIYISNDLGYASEKPGFGLPAGGLEDWRTGFYLNDSWKVKPYLTLSLGARYDRDTGRSNSDLAAIPCSAIVSGNFSDLPTCPSSGNLLDLWGPNLGGRVAQPNKNVGPQFGFNYAPPSLHEKTVIHGGVGLFFESNVFNNVQFDRASRLPTGEFASYPYICAGNTTLTTPGGVVNSVNGHSISSICNESIGAGEADVLALQALMRPSTSTASANPSFAGYGLSIENGAIAYGQNYRSPYSTNFNIGGQQQLRRGLVLTVDYIRNVTRRIQQTTDQNHVGDSRYFHPDVAANAVQRTLNFCRTTTVDATLLPNGCNATKANGGPHTATIADYAEHGLDSGVTYLGGTPYTYSGNTTRAAFSGVNPLIGVGTFSLPQGKSGYDGLQFDLHGQAAHPFPGIETGLIEVSYALSRFYTSTAENGISTSDPFFSPPSYDNRDPGGVLGYAGLDRRNIFSIGFSGTLKYGLKVGLIAHVDSAVPTNLRVDTQGGAPGEIFRSDLDGDGQTGDLLPGTKPGAYGRQVKPRDLANVISYYNATVAGNPTPAGQQLLDSNIFTSAELSALGGVAPTLATPPANAFANTMLKTLDMNFSYPIRLDRYRKGLSLEPGVALYNLPNFANYGGPSTTVATAADVTDGDPNGQNNFGVQNELRVSRKTGTFDQGAPRGTEFQLKLNF